uniref:Uncharacterized protein n=1 Tax=Anopheles maculatus TaxID=74869 RepID=A0A182S969_9DIPT
SNTSPLSEINSPITSPKQQDVSPRTANGGREPQPVTGMTNAIGTLSIENAQPPPPPSSVRSPSSTNTSSGGQCVVLVNGNSGSGVTNFSSPNHQQHGSRSGGGGGGGRSQHHHGTPTGVSSGESCHREGSASRYRARSGRHADDPSRRRTSRDRPPRPAMGGGGGMGGHQTRSVVPFIRPAVDLPHGYGKLAMPYSNTAGSLV